jgi:mono/diheme cytochrome c family protein
MHKIYYKKLGFGGNMVNLLLWMFVACEDSDKNDDTNLTGDEANGQVLYDANCAGCHGASADGGSGPSLLGEDLGEFLEVVPNGEGSMPAFPDMSDQDIADIYAFVQTLSN